jgi:type IV pilus assembly protein PilB
MKQRLGDILVAHGALDTLQLHAALAYQRTWGVPLGQVVVDQRFCTAAQVLQALATQTGLPAVDLDGLALEPALARLVPLKVAEAHRVVPLRVEGPRDTVLVVAIAAPATLTSLDAVKSVSGKGRVTPHLATDAAIQRAIRRLYHREDVPAPAPASFEAISLPEAEADMPFEVESWAAVVNTPVHGLHVRALRQPGTPGGPPPAGGASPTPAPFRPPPPAAAQAPSAGPAPAAGATPPPLPSTRRTTGSFPAVQPDASAQPPHPSGTFPAVQSAPPAVASVGARVLIYGWGTEATAALLRSLASEGLPIQVASTAEVLAADGRAIVIAPLPAMEGVGQRVRAQLLVAGKAPEVDLARAQALGAKGFLAAPLDADLLLRAVRRLRKAAEEEQG